MGFSALVLNQTEDGKIESQVTELDDSQLPEGDVTINVEWSSLNYKDGMVLQGIGRLVRDYPHVPGVDMAGVVESSDSDAFAPGDRVALTGWRVGEVHWGGYASKARVKGEWLVKLPDAISTREAMIIGTAGFTGMQALVALEAAGLSTSEDRQLLVTGASGGVGSSAVMWAGLAGHQVTASTGRLENQDELLALGASAVIDRAELAENPSRPMLGERWAGCIDAVGGDTLAHVLTELGYGTSVAACGLAGGNSLNTTVVPFLLRGVNLLGIDSVMCPASHRAVIWNRIADVIDSDKLDSLATEAGLGDLPALAPAILAGQVKGRTVVRVA